MHDLFTAHQMSKITQSAISQKLVTPQKTKNTHLGYKIWHFPANLWLKIQKQMAKNLH